MADKIPNKRRQASDNTTEESNSDIGEDDNDGKKGLLLHLQHKILGSLEL